jgi:hypothetical protein
MRTRKFLNKELDINAIKSDIDSRDLKGVHCHKRGQMDAEYDIIEFIVGRGNDYTYAFKVYLIETKIKRIERVRFQWECGGWRGKDSVIKKFPLNLFDENVTEKILIDYL